VESSRSGRGSDSELNHVSEVMATVSYTESRIMTTSMPAGEWLYEIKFDGTVTEGTVLKKLRSMERAVQSDLSVLGRGRRVGLPVL
jgi:hypothetical protein